MAKGCGTCTLCCTLMKVEMSPGGPFKPEGERCPHVCSKGCRIYDARPKPCAEFECLWLLSQKRTDGSAMPKYLKPDRTGVVLEVTGEGSGVVAHCTKAKEAANGNMGRWLRGVAEEVPVLIDEVGEEDAHQLQPNGQLVPLRFIGVDPVTNARKYIRYGNKGAEAVL